MENQSEQVKITITKDRMEAYIDHNDLLEQEEITSGTIYDLLKEKGVIFGMDEDVIHRVGANDASLTFPVLVALGKDPRHGTDGKVVFDEDFSMEIDNQQKASFRDIIQIPSVHAGDRIAIIEPSTKGTPGKDVHGDAVPSKPGKPVTLRAGKNATFKSVDGSYVAEIDGQLSFDERYIHVQPLYEVKGDLDLKTGNLDFVGSIVIRGNVPTGYCVKAQGDISIYGLVEGAEIIAEGSVHISEGIAGLGKAHIQAGLDVRVGYINQAEVEAGQDLFVEHSILHSQTVAKRNIFCQRGNIIGGMTSAGSKVEAKDIGNRMSTPTSIYLGLNKKIEEKRTQLNGILESKQFEKEKLLLIGQKLEQKKKIQGELPPQDRITILRQKKSLEIVEEDIETTGEQLETLSSTIGNADESHIQVNRQLFSNVNVGFGKYQYKVMQEHKDVHALIEDGEIIIRSNV